MSTALTIEIRPFRPIDHEAWMPLWRDYQTFYKASLSAEVTATTWSRLLDPAEPMFGALAWFGPEAVGIVHAIRHRSCWTTGDYCYLQDLFVAEGRRGGGIGGRLIDHVCAVAAAQGCSRVHWLTHETNVDAMKLYDRIAERSGFVQYNKLLADR